MHLPVDERRRWIPEFLCLLICTAAATAIFTWTDLDLRVSRIFYDPHAAGGPWPAAGRIPWSVLHHITPWLAAGFGFLGLGIIVSGMFVPGAKRRRLDGALLVLSLALGPGLVVNAVFKDHWKRPRPRQTITLGGDHAYVPPLRMGPAGKSFPCGHCSVGFAYGAFYYALRRRRPAAARVCLVVSAVAGTLLGFGRVVSGGHFASDVVWSASLTYGTMALVYYAILRLPWREEALSAALPGAPAVRPRPGVFAQLPRAARVALVVVAGSLLVFLVLLATPFEKTLGRSFAPGITPGNPWHLIVRVGVGHARLVLETDDPLVESGGSFDGFGFPGGRIEESLLADAPGRRVVYAVESRGWFTDLEGQAILEIAAQAVAAVEVEVTDGLLTIESRLGQAPPPEITCRIRADALRLRGGLRRDHVRMVAPDDRSRN